MRTFGKFAILCAAAIAAAAPAKAADRATGTYIGGGLGVNFAGDNDVDGGGIDTGVDHEAGIAGVLALGHSYANGLRGEIELGHRSNNVESTGGANTGGNSSVLSGMINGYYDFATGTSVIPYLGAGIGIGRLSMNADPIGNTAINSAGTGLALQGIAGLAYPINESWMGTVEYRYFNLQGVEVNTLAGGQVDVDYDAHTFMVGLRYTFGAEEKKPMAQPAAAPAPKPAPVAEKKPEPKPEPPKPAPVARNYIVFFDWDRADITSEAASILKTAAENAKKGGISRIQATGHADTSGTKTYNLKLSERRARAVQAELNKLGITTNQIAIDWKGELEQLVPTADGVREPQNRRVEIVFP